MREKLARAVLRDLRQQGHEHVELRREGATVVFFCSLCGTRCYNDSALGDHLNGKGHARHYNSMHASDDECKRNFDDGKNLASVTTKLGEDSEKASSSASEEDCSVTETIGLGASTTSLKWIGSGELFIRTKSTGTPFVEASWFSWQGMYQCAETSWNDNDAARMEYAW